MPRTYQPKFVNGELNPKYKFRKRPKGKTSGKKVSKFQRGTFIAYDGEGITTAKGKHIYIMLCNSLGEEIVNPKGLSTADCLDFLIRTGEENRNAIHVCFGASYDVNMILADVPRAQLERIWNGEWVDICDKQYTVNYRPRKSFTVRRRNAFENRGGKLVKIKNNGLVLWDVFGFFQGTFVSAVEKYLGADHPHLSFITEQKKLRGTFKEKQIPEILRYCHAECVVLRELMERLREYLITAELLISRWDGAGACAAALLRREKISEHKGIESDYAVLEAAQCAYAGGRSEIIQYGHKPDTPIYHYDICSAYPAAMLSLPSFERGVWIHSNNISEPPSDNIFAMYRVRWEFNDAAMYPLFWRASDASIFYPQEGEGWYWSPEIAATCEALECGIISGKFEILEKWEWRTGSPNKPFEFLPALYEQRREWKKQGVGAEKVLKLAINSCYGKLAQHLGGTEEKPPRYHKLEWAGFITSQTRANLYRALFPALKVDAAIMVATDAVYSLVPLPQLPIGSALGNWEYTEHTGITVVQSGVYWVDNGNDSSMFCRGFDKGSLDRAKIIRGWKKKDSSYSASLTRFITMGSALQGKKSFNKWRTWSERPRELSLNVSGTKRVDAIEFNKRNPALGLVTTYPAIPGAQVVGQVMSSAYPLPWIEAAAARSASFDGVPLHIVEAEAMETEL